MADRFRKEYKLVSDDAIDLIRSIKDKANELALLVSHVDDDRAKELAFVNLEQAIMWAVKGITG